ncbi:Nuclear transport factor 2 (NTF2) domain [Musa troglodytarum]|uniref:Nuclear transport factor 2 (NTF2) domain n=1 Tax=Musa troglodytarum TaxID=320322 RepID=A0A9E7F548_9LILI|nr:Nuclear transport factor 2 (NTF2) domain [Musa troglodytarum]
MASLYPGHVGAVQVGAYFLEQYYRILQQQPELVHQFYTDVSSMARFDGTATETATGMVEKGFFVLNDIFHLLEEEHVHQHPAAIVGHSNFETNLNVSSSVPETVSDYMLGEQVQAQDLVPPVHVEENDIVEKYGIPEAPQQLPQPDERIDEFPAEDTASYPSGLDTTREPRPATPEEPAGEPTRQTYASISTAQQPQPAMVPEKSSSEAVEEALPVEDEGEARSVYVGNLPSSISASDLEQVFKNFGRLRSDGVSIRSRKESDVFYAFIEYEDAIGVQNALKASPIQLNGRLIHVEGRRPNSGASRGKRGRGRGGYPSEASRGRFSSRNFGRGSRQDSYDRDYNSRPRGNGYPQRVQERGS